MRVGLIGLGRMGAALAGRLRAEGFEVIGWDHDPARIAALGNSITPAANPRAVAEAADVVLSIITEDSGVRALWHGEAGYLEAEIAGKLFIEMSTLQPMTVRELAAIATARGATLVDSPVLGSIPTVREGKLTSLIGGSAADIARATETLRHVTARIIHMGPVGAGSTMKLAVNNLMGCYLQVLGESLAMGTSQGLDLNQMLEVIGASITATPWFKSKQSILAGGADDTTLDLRTLRKDIMSVVATAAVAGVPTPVAAGTLAALSAAVQSGIGGHDIAELPRFFREQMLQRWD